MHKYGGSSLANIDRIRAVAQHIRHVYAQGQDLVVVVSAMGDSTDELTDLARQIHPDPPRRELDMLLTAGERISMALLSMALHGMNIPSVSLTGSQCGILTTEHHGRARVRAITGQRIQSALEQKYVVIVAGFQGVHPESREVTTLGRGGSDLTAVALAVSLMAQSCEFYKDVEGILSADPRLVEKAQKRTQMTYEQAVALMSSGSGVIHNRAVLLAAKHKLPLTIKSSFHPELPGTLIS